ncbi:MAG: TolC family protein, partial [Wenzhouxiangellaceae bacterium]
MINKFPILAALSLTLLAPAAGAVDLMGVFEMASRNDAEFKAAERRLEAREFDRAIARSSFLPQASGTLQRAIGTARPELDGESLDNRRTNTENYGVQITQSIYNDANFGRMNRARATIAQANAQFNVAWQDFLLRNAQRYFDMLTAIDTLRFAEAEETALRRQFEQAEQRFEVGLSAVT